MESKPETLFLGSGVSSGVVIGQALKIDRNNRLILKLTVEDVEVEVERYLKAIEISKEQVQALKSRLEEKVGEEHGVILDTHFLILDDATLHAEIIENIHRYQANAEWSLTQATDRLVHAYKSLEDEYFRERHSDVEHVVERILLNLLGDQPFSLGRLPEDVILVCHDFNPSNFATMNLEKVRGLAMESGGRTAHTAIISRGLRLPAVMGIRDILTSVSTGDTLMLDGDAGLVVINPSPERIESVRQKQNRVQTPETTEIAAADKTLTRDGKPISLRANTELQHEIITAKSCGAEGIGLYRSEFLYFSHSQEYPSMDRQLCVYRALAKAMHPHPVAIRTLDAGSERILKSPDTECLINPSMGLRGIRLSLQIKDVFVAQIEAILRAACDGNIEMVLPMVSTIEEIWQAKELIAKVRDRLYKEFGIEPPPVRLGIMIEVPAAVLALEAMAKDVDFFCVGTNDLIQYLLAVDRGNSQVAYLYQPLHPSVLNCLAQISTACAKMKKPVRICGEISANPFLALLLAGMGFTQLSMNPLSIGMIRKVIREVSLRECRKIAKNALTMITAKDVHDHLIKEVSRIIPFDLAEYINELAPADYRIRE